MTTLWNILSIEWVQMLLMLVVMFISFLLLTAWAIVSAYRKGGGVDRNKCVDCRADTSSGPKRVGRVRTRDVARGSDGVWRAIDAWECSDCVKKSARPVIV